jgi:transposase InsO family protein
LVKKTKRFHITTDSKHFFFKSPNLLKDLTLSHAEQVFVSDITYIKVMVVTLFGFVTDAYSKKIMGWKLDDNISLTKRTIHSDREYNIVAQIILNLLKIKALY